MHERHPPDRGLIWEGKPRYATLDAALQDLDQALAAWFKAEMRE